VWAINQHCANVIKHTLPPIPGPSKTSLPFRFPDQYFEHNTDLLPHPLYSPWFDYTNSYWFLWLNAVEALDLAHPTYLCKQLLYLLKLCILVAAGLLTLLWQGQWYHFHLQIQGDHWQPSSYSSEVTKFTWKCLVTRYIRRTIMTRDTINLYHFQIITF
jgi:hypothetical protein